MKIAGIIKTDIRINIEDVGAKASINTTMPESQTTGEPLPANIDAATAEMERAGRENSIKWMNREREGFYMADSTLEYTPGEHSVEIEIALATQRGYTAIVDGQLAPSFSEVLFKDNDALSAISPNSPLDFVAKVSNLKNLYEHLGDKAASYNAEFGAALQGVIDEFIEKGGIYVQADKIGIADSIRAMFSGEEGKYTADDLRTMAVLDIETMAGHYMAGDSEHALGARLGFDALKIEMARNAGKLSDSAYSTVKGAFNARVEELVKEMDKALNSQKSDPFMPKDVGYSPARPESVSKAIDFMLSALDSNDFNQGFRAALRGLEHMHNAQRESQLENGSLDQRYNIQFFGGKQDRTLMNDSIQISSRFFAEYLSQPQWAISGNVFSVDVAV